VELPAFQNRRLYRVSCPISPDCEIEMGRQKICTTGIYAWFACPTGENTPSDERRTELVLCNQPSEQGDGAPRQIDVARCDERGVAEVFKE
jgi:hypothetical protein